MVKIYFILAFVALISTSANSQETDFSKLIKANFDTLTTYLYGSTKPDHSSIMRVSRFMESLTGIESTAYCYCYAGGKLPPNFQDYISWSNWYFAELKKEPWTLKYGVRKKGKLFVNDFL